MNQNQFLLDSGFWGWLYKLLYPVEWLMTQIMAVFHKFLVMLGMNEIGFSWVMSIVFLVLVVQACVFPLFYKSMKGMRKMQAQMAVLQPKMQRIQNKYKGKNDPASKEAMQREMMKLYQDNDANPMGGLHFHAPYVRAGSRIHVHVLYAVSHSVHRTRQIQGRTGSWRFRHRHSQAVHVHHSVWCERG